MSLVRSNIIKMNNYRDRIKKPISAKCAVGERLLDDPLLDFVETQMIKVGSLSHSEVQWDEIEKISLNLLEKKTKDLKILTYLLQCLQYQASAERFTLSVYILIDFMSAFWDTCYPAPGARGALPRRKFFSQIALRIFKSAQKLDGAMFDVDLKIELTEALEKWKEVVQECSLPVDLVEDIQVLLANKLSSLSDNLLATETQYSALATLSQSTHTDLSTPTKFDIDGSSDRATKQTLFKMAEFLTELDNGAVYSLRLRRLATWLAIVSPPDADQHGQTQLMPVSIDRIREYEEQLEREADLVLWHKVEKSLALTPFWLDGHYLSFRIAMKLGEKDLATAIRDEILIFIERLPSLLTMCFQGSIAFASEETQCWINEAKNPTGVGAMPGLWDEILKKAFVLAEEGGVSVALAMLNDGLKDAQEPRDKFYWRMLSADVMHNYKLDALASEQYETLKIQAQSLSVIDWEPSLIQRLENVTETKT